MWPFNKKPQDPDSPDVIIAAQRKGLRRRLDIFFMSYCILAYSEWESRSYADGAAMKYVCLSDKEEDEKKY